MCEGNQVLLPFSETLPLDEIVELTQRLIEFHSTPDNPAELAACRAFLTEWCAREGLNARAYDVRPGGVLYVGPDSGRAPLLQLSHFDVAAGPDALFSPLLCDDQLYGRGALDDKYAVALSLVLYREACRTAEQHGGTQEDVPLMLLLSGGGEEDDMLGIQSVLETLMPEFCIALDGGEPKHIVIKEKGMLRLELASYGEAADGAQPWKGKNATNTLIADYLVLLSLLQRKDNISDPTYWHPTLNLNKLRAGLSPNLVPDSATAQLDVRFTEYDDPKILYDELRRSISGSLGIVSEAPVFESLPSPWRNLLFRVTGASAAKGHGGSGAHHFSQLGLSGVAWGADGDDSRHSMSEHLNISSLRPVYEGLVRMVNAAFDYKKENAG